MPLFKVIVELFECEFSDRYYSSFLNESRPDHKELIRILTQSTGIYAFYNSELEAIYVGKTKNNLWSEMKTAYNRYMPHYKRYYVSHPRHKFSVSKSGLARKIQLKNVRVWETASYFSAYSVAEEHIDDLERFLIRIMPNDIANKRMEGNASLSMHVESEET